MNIVGISGGYHDSACCLLQDGALIAASSEERFSRIKNDRSPPRRAFRYCLEEGGITLDQVDAVAFYEDPTLKLGRQLWMNMGNGIAAQRRRDLLTRMLEPSPLDWIRTELGFEGHVEIVDHHLSHAASAYYFSGFDQAAILTVDGVGDWPTTTYSVASGSDIRRLESVDFPHSLGLFYSTITGYLGFEVNEGEYKIMGLAPYGTPRYADRIQKLILSGQGGQYALDMRYFGFLHDDCMYSPELIELMGRPAREAEGPLEQFHMDVARSAQAVLEEVMLEKVRYLHTQAPVDALCMAGGVALNVVANGRCLREGPFKKLFVQPAAGDAGGALGCAATAHARLTGERPAPIKTVYLGPQPSVDSIHRLLAATPAVYGDYRDDEAGLIEKVVDRLVEGAVVAWYHGRAEFGPRALGHRSILADPRRPEMRDKINALVKMREAFRPFAPSVLASEQANHFELDHDSPFMLETCKVRSALELPAITHVDGTARVHSVTAESNPRFAALLAAFFARTGCPILLNTSFNQRGEPIVETPADAIATFVRSSLDLLVLEDFTIERDDVPAYWHLTMRKPPRKAPKGAAVQHLVYTFL